MANITNTHRPLYCNNAKSRAVITVENAHQLIADLQSITRISFLFCNPFLLWVNNIFQDSTPLYLKGMQAYPKGRTSYQKDETAYLKDRTAYLKDGTLYLKGRTVYFKGETLYLKGETVYHKGGTVYLFISKLYFLFIK